MCMCAKSLQSCPTLHNPMDCSPPAPLSMGFSRHKYWSGLPFPSPRDLPDPRTLVSCIADGFLPSEPPGKPKKRRTYLHDRTVCLVTQLCLTLCDPMDCSPPGSSVPGILQPRVLEWVAMPFSRGSSQPKDRTQVSCIRGRCFNL